MPGHCPASLRPPAVRLWKTFRSKPNTIPVDDKNVFAFPPESAFAFRTECCSESQRNGVRLQTGIAFAFDRIPQLLLRETFETRKPLISGLPRNVWQLTPLSMLRHLWSPPECRKNWVEREAVCENVSSL